MQGDDVTGLVEVLHVGEVSDILVLLGGALLALLEERLEAVDLHTEAACNTCGAAGGVTEGVEADLLTHQLASGLAIEAVACCEDEQTKDKLTDSIGVLSGGVLYDHALLLGVLGVDGVVSGTGADDHLQLLGGVDHLLGDLVAADDKGVGVSDSLQQLILALILLQHLQLVAGILYDLADLWYCGGVEGLLSSY